MHKLIKKTMSIIAALAITLGIVAAPLTAEPVSAESKSILGVGDDGILTIAIDAGHGGSDPGAVSSSKYGLHESDLNLTISKYLVDYLNQYRGVRAFLTRTDDTYWGLTNRVTYAVKQNADIFIAIHNNASGTNKKASFSMVYVPNNNYRKKLATEGIGVAKSILSELEALGRQNNGTQSVNSSGSSKYPDGSTKDYYAVIRESKEQGIPGIIVEHAFITTEADVKRWFLSDESLKELAEADGRGIVSYYGLIKEPTSGLLQSVTVDGVDATISINAYADSMTYDIYRGEDENHMSLVKTIKKGAGTSGQVITYEDKNLKMDKDYYYYVIAKDLLGNNFVSQTEVVDTAVDIEKIEAHSTGTGKITISWNPVNGVGGYRVFRKDSANGEYVKVGKTYTDVDATYTDTVPALNKTYYYYVDAYQKIDTKYTMSDPSEVVKARTIDKPVIASITQASNGKMVIKWGKVAGADEYNVYRKTTGGSYEKLETVDSTTFKDDTCEPGKPYNYRIEAVVYIDEVEGHSDMSSAVKATRIADPEITSISFNTKYNTTIEWDVSEGATTYELYRADGAGSEKYKLLKTITDTSTCKYVDKTTQLGGTYSYRIKATQKNGKVSGNTAYSTYEDYTVVPRTSKLTAKTVSNGVELTWKKNSRATGYIIYRSDSVDGTLTRIKNITKNTTTSYVDTTAGSGTYYYSIRTYVKTSTFGTTRSDYSKRVSVGAVLSQPAASVETPVEKPAETPVENTDISASATEGYTICGTSSATAEQMVAYYKSRGVTFPSDIYATRGAATIEEFAQIVYEEANAEGVKAEVVFAQVMKETGLIQFPNCDVSPEQCNFAGIGATGNGVKGNEFPDVRTGIRAQVQHLKAYGSTEPLVNECVDPRFNLVTRGNAIYVEWLGINENPNHAGWAGDPGYGFSLVNDYIAKIVKM